MTERQHPNNQADGFFGPLSCTSEIDGSMCFCGKCLKPQPPMGPIGGRLIYSVDALSRIPYGMRLERGFAILSGNKHDL
jgi:hypothetical protein